MKLLFDQNVSPRLVGLLADCYPDSTHVRKCGLASADDAAVWSFAAANGLIVVSKDSDFHQRSLLFGAPPKVVWVQLGNCTTAEIAEILRRHQSELVAFDRDATAAFLILG